MKKTDKMIFIIETMTYHLDKMIFIIETMIFYHTNKIIFIIKTLAFILGTNDLNFKRGEVAQNGIFINKSPRSWSSANLLRAVSSP